jgi:hypothetical protein
MKAAEGSSVQAMPRSAVFGGYPKRITCQCNAEETRDDVTLIEMNGRCAVCNQHYRVSIPKPAMQFGRPEQY